jgi:hypothetical protein
MSRAPLIALALVPILAAAVAPSARRFKEVACLQISAPAGTQLPRLIVTVRGEGLRVFRSNCAPPFGGTAIVHDTLAAPAKLVVFGIGETELAGLDSTVQYTVQIQGVLGSATETRSVTGSRIIIGHLKMVEPFSIRAVNAGNR